MSTNPEDAYDASYGREPRLRQQKGIEMQEQMDMQAEKEMIDAELRVREPDFKSSFARIPKGRRGTPLVVIAGDDVYQFHHYDNKTAIYFRVDSYVLK